MSRCVLHWLLLALLLCGSAAARAAEPALPGDPYFETVGDAESIPDNNVTALVEDRTGFIWIGTPNGLIRYDGYRFRRFLHDAADPRSISGNFIRCLLVAGDGRLWVGTDADGLSVYDPAAATFERFHKAHGLAHDSVRALAEDRLGGIWIGTRAGLNYWHPRQPGFAAFAQRLGADAKPEEDRILALLADRRGDLWVGAWQGLSRLPAGTTRFERVHADPAAALNLAGQMVLSLFELADGRIGIGTTQSGSWLLDPAGGPAALLRIPAGMSASVSPTEAMVLAMAQPSPAELWLGGFGGIAVVDPASGRLLRQLLPDPSVGSSLSNSQVRAFLQDRAGQLWLGGYSGGLQRHDPHNDGVRVLHHVPSRPGSLTSPSIGSVLEIDDGTIWAGTRQNGIDIIERSSGRVIDGWRPAPGQPGALGNGMVISLAQTADRSIWAGTLSGLYRLLPDTREWAGVGEADGLLGSTVRRLLAGQRGELWIGSNAGLAHWQPGATGVRAIPVAGQGVLAADVNALVQEADGRLWVGSSAGLYTLPAGAEALQRVTLQRPDGGTGDAAGSVIGLLLDRQGRLWVDTTDGLLRISHRDGRPSALDAVSARLGIGGQTYGANLLEDHAGRIWSQYYVHDPVAGTVYKLGRADGVDIGTPWFRSYARTRDGLLLFGGSKGLLVIDPRRFRHWAYPPPVVATELKIDGQPQPLPGAEGIVLPATANGFSLEFAALDFSGPLRNRYAYRLLGYDRDWKESEASHRIASYTNLWPGRYTLQVRGSNRTGSYAPQQLELPLRVLPAFWQTPWFVLLALLGLAGLVHGAFRLHSARIRRHERELQRLVEQRTAELSLAKSRAETALVELKGAQRQLVVAEKMASLGQLVAGVAHEINTPLGIALTAASMHSDQLGVLKKRVADHALRGTDLNAYLDIAGQAAQLVDTQLARAAQLVRSFKQVAVDRSLDQRRRFELSTCLADLAVQLEHTWKRRPVTLRLDCEPGLELDSYPATLAQVIGIFVQNALLHAFDETTPGTMWLLAQGGPDGQISLSFSDDGRGIAADQLGRVFEPFFTTRRAQGCTGLGLHTAYNLVSARLGGEIVVDSAPDRGTCFTLHFPRVAPGERA